MKNKIKNIHIVRGNYKNGTERSSAGMKYIKKRYSGYMIISCDNPMFHLKQLNQQLKFLKIVFIKKLLAQQFIRSRFQKNLMIKV